MSLSTREPLAIRAAIIAAVQSSIYLAVSFGLVLTAEQIAALSAATGTLSILAVVLWARGKVTPEEIVQGRISDAVAQAVIPEDDYAGAHRAA